MRNNQPVTQVEMEMRDGQTIVSTTDTKGIITSVNDCFCEMAGYSREELIGQPHNLIRHPDMPESAFKWLWDTLADGKSWTGIVKNRRKDGGFYWVQANVTAVIEGGETVGYISVRTKPTREQIDGAAALYKAINSGEVVLGSKSILDHLNFFSRLKVWQRILLLVMIVGSTLTGSWMLTMGGLNRAYDGMLMASNDGAVGKAVGDVDSYVLRSQVHILEVANTHHLAAEMRKDGKEAEEDLVSMKKSMDFVLSSDLSGEEKESSAAFVHAIKNYENEILAPAALAMRNADFEAVKEISSHIKSESFIKASAAKLRFDNLQRDISAEEVKIAATDYKEVYRNSIVLAVLSLLLSSLMAWIVINRLNKRLRYTRDRLNSIAGGNYFDWVEIDHEDEIGSLLHDLKSMQIRQGFAMEEINNKAMEALRIKEALDEVSIPVQIADMNYNIFYMNNAAYAMFEKYKADLMTALPNYNPDKLMGSNIDIYHKDPSHQRRILDNLTQSYTSGDLPFSDTTVVRVTASPIRDDGTRIGTVLEWHDRSEEIGVEREVQNMVTAAEAGDLTQRVTTEGKEGFFALLAGQMNSLVSIVEHVVDDTVSVFGALADGKLTVTIDRDYRGSFDELKTNANDSVSRLQELIGNVSEIAGDVSSGATEVADGSLSLSDRTQQQAAALEQTAASIEEMTSTVEHNTDNARQANELAANTRMQAEQGGVVVAKAINAMGDITSSSKKISDIIGVIDEIAFQTNLLALNAAVEAARAGDAGRGFAVVAGEVRTLAGRSADAAKEIKGLINASVSSVEGGSKLVTESGEALNGIVESVRKVSNVIAEIASASEEQSSGISQINQAITAMDSTTQQNAALVEETSAAGKQLDDRASELIEMVNAFDVGK
ncbi:MAG: methyl-accepting chemotaxis protein [Mariprofundaceae bacterium]